LIAAENSGGRATRLEIRRSDSRSNLAAADEKE
jgi:hypothetical protein